MTEPSLTRKLARLVRGREVEPDDLRIAGRYVKDWLGSYVAGRAAEPGRIVRRYARGLRDLEGRLFRAAALSHVTETDDLHRGSTTHPGCVVIPTAWLTALETGADGPALLRAVLDGYETMIRIGEALGPEHYRTFHNTATSGVFGAAAAAASVLSLDEDRWVWALGSAGTQAAGLWQFNEEGAMSKPLHAGHAAAAGLRSALLAREGFTGAERILEGETGFFRGLCPDARPGAVLRDAGRWRLAETSLKPYPCCRHTHPVVDAALELRERLGLDRESASGLEEIRIASYEAALRRTDEPLPSTPLAARFSVQYCGALALLDGTPELASFAPDRVPDPGVRGLLERTRVTLDADLDAAYPEHWGGEVLLRAADGESHRARVADARGDPERPLSEDEVDGKVRSLLAHGGLEEVEADALLERCGELHRGGNLFELPRPPTGDLPVASGGRAGPGRGR